jgi:formate/nitrite transporter FocA (FNT family)
MAMSSSPSSDDAGSEEKDHKEGNADPAKADTADSTNEAPAVELTPREVKDMRERMRPRAAVLHETIRSEGEHELHRSPTSLAWSGLAAGMSLGFSLVAMGVLRAALPDAPWRPLVVSLGYPVGFLIVILGRQQLFTENTLTPVLPLLHNRDAETLVRVLRLWSIVLITNILGAFLFATTLAKTAIFKPEIRAAFGDIGVEALAGGAGVHFLRAIFSGWLVALLVWLLPGADTSGAFLIVVISYLIGVAGLSHIIAGSVESLFAVLTGRGTWSDYAFHYFVPVLLGNILGGSALVGAVAHAQVVAERDLKLSREKRRGDLS